MYFCCLRSTSVSDKKFALGLPTIRVDSHSEQPLINVNEKPAPSIQIRNIPPAEMSTDELKEAIASLSQSALSFERTEPFTFNTDIFPKDFETPFIELVAREVYKRNIIANKGRFSDDGRLKKWPAKKKNWEAIIRYIGTLIEARDEPFEQSEILAIVNYFVPEAWRPASSVSPTVFVTNLVAMGILEREMGGSRMWRRKGTKHPLPLGQGILPNF